MDSTAIAERIPADPDPDGDEKPTEATEPDADTAGEGTPEPASDTAH